MKTSKIVGGRPWAGWQLLPRLAALCASALALAACTTTGTGSGQLTGSPTTTGPVLFTWTSNDGGISGAISAAMPEATFQGRFFQITQQTRSEVLTPLWNHWNRGWNDWPYWSGQGAPLYPATQFVTHYTGKVVATLASANQQQMRCRFHMVDPLRGMSGGGEGECQLSGGRVIHAVFVVQ